MEQLLQEFRINPVYAEITVKKEVMSMNIEPQILEELIKLNKPSVFNIKNLTYEFMLVYMSVRNCEKDEFFKTFLSTLKKKDEDEDDESVEDKEEIDLLEELILFDEDDDNDDSFIDDSDMKKIDLSKELILFDEDDDNDDSFIDDSESEEEILNN